MREAALKGHALQTLVLKVYRSEGWAVHGAEASSTRVQRPGRDAFWFTRAHDVLGSDVVGTHAERGILFLQLTGGSKGKAAERRAKLEGFPWPRQLLGPGEGPRLRVQVGRGRQEPDRLDARRRVPFLEVYDLLPDGTWEASVKYLAGADGEAKKERWVDPS